MTASLPATAEFAGTSLSIVERDGTPWVSAADLAHALGYATSNAVSRIYARHASEFTDEMTLRVNLTLKGFGSGNSEKEVRIFSPRGCHLIAMFSHTDRAAAFRRWVLDVLEGLALPPAAQPPADLTLPDIFPPLTGMITEPAKALLASHLLATLQRFGAMPHVIAELDRYGQLPVPRETQRQLAALKAQTKLMAVESARLAAVAEAMADKCLGLGFDPPALGDDSKR